jgi:hypothetical protein
MLALSKKFSSDCSMNTLVIYPSLFHSIIEESSDFGYSSSQVFSLMDDTADSDWQLSKKKCVSTIYGPSESDTDSHLTLDHDTHHNSNYVTNSASQDSKDEGSKCGNCNENEIQGDSMDTGDEEARESTNLQYKGPR